MTAKRIYLAKKTVWFWPDNFSTECWELLENLSRNGRDPLVDFLCIFWWKVTRLGVQYVNKAHGVSSQTESEACDLDIRRLLHSRCYIIRDIAFRKVYVYRRASWKDHKCRSLSSVITLFDGAYIWLPLNSDFPKHQRILKIRQPFINIRFGSFDYLDFCSRNGLSTLYERRDLLARQFFFNIALWYWDTYCMFLCHYVLNSRLFFMIAMCKLFYNTIAACQRPVGPLLSNKCMYVCILNKCSCLNYLLPEERSDRVIGKLRHPSIF